MNPFTAKVLRTTMPKPFIDWMDKRFPDWPSKEGEYITHMYAAWHEGCEHMTEFVKSVTA